MRKCATWKYSNQGIGFPIFSSNFSLFRITPLSATSMNLVKMPHLQAVKEVGSLPGGNHNWPIKVLNSESGVTNNFCVLSQTLNDTKHSGVVVYSGDRALPVSHIFQRTVSHERHYLEWFSNLLYILDCSV